ncbi:T9SS type A sorting domain-containing protein [Flavobacterium sp. ZB4P13]|uniref:T9SS type A sorting domain-containing protein n=1 Tax=Flavobacterium sp. ZB4P13 TaxID=3401728 RepID=UPI003AAF592C
MIRSTLIFIFIINVCYSQAPIIQWEKSYGGNQVDIANGICQTADGGYVFIGSTNSQNGDVVGNPYPFSEFYTRTSWIVKISSTGAIEWQKIYGGYAHDETTAIKQTTDGGFIVSGFSASSTGDVTNSVGGRDFWILKLNATGNLQWQKSFGSTSSDKAFDIIQTSDGGYAAIGYLRYPSNYGSDHWYNELSVVKLSDTGTVQWSKRFGGTRYDMGYGIIQTDDNGFMLVGRAQSKDGDVKSNHGLFDAWVIKTNSLGVLQWQKTYGGTADDAAVGIVKANDGNYVVLGETTSKDGDVTSNYGSVDLWVFKINPAGDIIWQNTYGGPSTQSAGIYLVNDPEQEQGQVPTGKISKTSDNGFLICGTTFGDIPGHHGSNNTDAYIAKINNEGVLVWQRAFGGSNNDEGAEIIQTSDNGYILAAQNLGHPITKPVDWSNNHGSYDAWIVKFTPDESLSIDELSTQQIIAYPNPVNTTLFIKAKENIIFDKIVITDITGKKVLTQTNDINKISVETLLSGVYFIEAFSQKQIFRSKFIKN